ncbi:MAG: GNAT family N-acetyltransferase [Flavisolibacter sp.]
MLNVEFPVFPVLETQRCHLREILPSDAPALLALRSNEEVMQFIDKDRMKSLEEAEELIGKINENVQKGEGISWAIVPKDGEEMIGFAGLWRIDKAHHRAEVGYTLMPEYWNKGLMSEVMRAMIDYGFQQMKIHSIEANINPLNQASKRLLEKHGFVQEAYFRENFYYNGKFLDSAIFSLLTPYR